MNGFVLRVLVPTALVFAALAGPLLSPSRAEAQRAGGLYLGGGIGPAINIDDAPNQFRLEVEIGYYVENEPRGFFLAFSPAQSFGAGWGIFTFPFRLGGMFDVHRSRDFTFQLGPTGTLGFALTDWFDVDDYLNAWFHMSISFMLRFLLLNEQLAIYVRPVEFEFFVGDSGPDRWANDAIRYVLVGGIHYHF